MRTLRRIFLSSLLLVSMPWALAQNSKGGVGILMPTVTSQRWVVDGLAMVRAMDKLGYRPDLKYANDDVATQIAQTEEMLKASDMKVLVIGAIDGSKLAPVLKKAADRQIKVIAYDRLIRDTPYVDYYATFDNFQVGVLQGSYIVEHLGVDKGKGPFTIELFGGSSDDNNAFFFYDGAMSVLKPYIDKGRLVVGSGQMGMEKVATQRWSGSVARARLVQILDKHYTKQRLDALLSPYDGISMELITAMKKANYGQAGQPLPVVTGQDAEMPSVRSIIRASKHLRFSKTTVNWPKWSPPWWTLFCRAKNPPSTTKKPTTTAKKSCPRFCSSLRWSISTTGAPRW